MNSLVLASLSLPNLVSRLPGGVAQGIIWGIMALGVYITFRLLDVADLTVDGSFTTGGAVTVVLIVAGWPAWAALLVAVAAGLLAGFVTGLLHTKLGIPAILAGILTQFALYSINLRIMSMKANTPVNPDKYDLFLTLRSVPGARRTVRPGWRSAAAFRRSSAAPRHPRRRAASRAAICAPPWSF